MMTNDESIKIAEDLESAGIIGNESCIEYITLNDVLGDLKLQEGSPEKWQYLHIIKFIEDKANQTLKKGVVVTIPFLGNIRYAKPRYTTTIQEQSKDYLDFRIRQHLMKYFKVNRQRNLNDYLGYAYMINWEYARMYISSLCLFEVI